jgi:outer membrane immunogenic protein
MLPKGTVVSAISALALCASVSASVADPSNWSGFSVSVGGGAAKTNTDLNVDTSNHDQLDIVPGSPPFFSIIGQALGHSGVSEDQWNGFGTVQAGYDHRIGNFVIGAFGDFDFYPNHPDAAASNNINGNLSFAFLGIPVGPVFPIANYASVTSNVELENTWSVGGRVGYLVAPNALLYALGGYTQAKFDGQVNLSYGNGNPITGPQVLSLSVPEELQGYFVGGGGELKVADHIALRLEYRYANYTGDTNSASANFNTSFGGGIATYNQTAQVQAHLDEQIQSVRAALVLKLGEP